MWWVSTPCQDGHLLIVTVKISQRFVALKRKKWRKNMQTYELDAAIMQLEGFRLIRVGYLGDAPGEDWPETPEQHGLPEWFTEETDDSIGAYWLNEERKLVYDAYHPEYTRTTQRPYSPSTNWAHGGPLIDKHRVHLVPYAKPHEMWMAQLWGEGRVLRAEVVRDTALEAAMFAIVTANTK
jgi:hypothetical protein